MVIVLDSADTDSRVCTSKAKDAREIERRLKGWLGKVCGGGGHSHREVRGVNKETLLETS